MKKETYIYKLEEIKEEEDKIITIDDYMEIIHKLSKKLNSVILPKEGRYTTYELFISKLRYSEILNNLGDCSCLIKDCKTANNILIKEEIILEEEYDNIRFIYKNKLGLKILFEIKLDKDYILEINNENVTIYNKKNWNEIYDEIENIDKINGDIIINCKEKRLIIECPFTEEENEIGILYSYITRILEFKNFVDIEEKYYASESNLEDLEEDIRNKEQIYYPIIEKKKVKKRKNKNYPEPIWSKDLFEILEDKEKEKEIIIEGYKEIKIEELQKKINKTGIKINLINIIKSKEEIEEYEKFFIKEEENNTKILSKIRKIYITTTHKNYRYLNIKLNEESISNIREINMNEGTLLNVREIKELEKRYKLNNLLKI